MIIVIMVLNDENLHRVRNEGEFWMSFDDFAKQFSHLDLVHIGPDDWMSEPALHRCDKIVVVVVVSAKRDIFSRKHHITNCV